MSLLSFAKKMSGRAAKTKQKKSAAGTSEGAAKNPTAPSSVNKDLTRRSGTLGLRPLITEDSVVMQGNTQTVVFRVRPQAAKRAIAAAVKERFGVEPVSVRTMQMSGKVRRRGRTYGTTASWKKAYVTLPAGQTIDPAGAGLI